LSNERDVKEIIESTIRHYHALDVLVNSAGIFELGSIENTDDGLLDQYDRIFSVNVRAVYHLTMLAVPHLVRSKGVVVNVSSVNGTRSFAGCLAYNLSKSALDQFTRCVALELAGKGVRVNSVNPGVVVTPQKKQRSSLDAAYAAFLERTRVAHALGRLGEPEEVARAIAFLASDQSTFVTGANLPVDGGRHVMCPGGIVMGSSQVDPTLSSSR
jgi:NAD(P)-dependent dehydrogenase (short-subunit alcohol dehydrogenase family)